MPVYSCQCCKFESPIKSLYNKHLTTIKHKKNTEDTMSVSSEVTDKTDISQSKIVQLEHSLEVQKITAEYELKIQKLIGEYEVKLLTQRLEFEQEKNKMLTMKIVQVEEFKPKEEPQIMKTKPIETESVHDVSSKEVAEVSKEPKQENEIVVRRKIMKLVIDNEPKSPKEEPKEKPKEEPKQELKDKPKNEKESNTVNEEYLNKNYGENQIINEFYKSIRVTDQDYENMKTTTNHDKAYKRILERNLEGLERNEMPCFYNKKKFWTNTKDGWIRSTKGLFYIRCEISKRLTMYLNEEYKDVFDEDDEDDESVSLRPRKDMDLFDDLSYIFIKYQEEDHDVDTQLKVLFEMGH